ncbi:MAG: MFS transporter, partial [Microbacteriaceae bacterium]
MAGYSDLLKTPGVARIITSQLVARFPFGMLSLVLLLHVERIFGSYGLAGTVLACYSIGQAIAGPTSSRLMGRFGMRPVLIVTLCLCLITVGSLSITTFPLPFYLIVGFFGGLTTPPIQPAVRTVYPKMVPSKMLTPLFSLDATAQEIIWVVGPVVATFTATQISTPAGVYLCVALMLIGGIWFICSPELGQVRIPPSRSKMGAVLKKPPVLLATIIGFLLIGGAAAIEAGVVAAFGHDGPEAGLVLAVFSVGSLAGGLAIGHRPIGKWALTLRILTVFV